MRTILIIDEPNIGPEVKTSWATSLTLLAPPAGVTVHKCSEEERSEITQAVEDWMDTVKTFGIRHADSTSEAEEGVNQYEMLSKLLERL